MPCFLTNFDVSNLTVSKQPRKVEFKYANIPLMFHLQTFLILFEKIFRGKCLGRLLHSIIYHFKIVFIP